MQARCLCGAIEVHAPDHDKAALCHCSICRRWSGGPMFAVHCGSHVQFSGAQPVAYRSSDWAERGFCGTCGTHLFYHLLPSNEYILPVGLFQDQTFTLTRQIFVDEKPGFYDFQNQTEQLTGQQVVAMYAQK